MQKPEIDLSETTEKIRKLFRELGGEPGKFKPCAIYNPEIDLLVVLIRDCSYCEHYVNLTVSVLMDDHVGTDNELVVGFHIWGVRQICKIKGLPTSGPVKVGLIVEAVRSLFLEHQIPSSLIRNLHLLLQKNSISLVELE